MKSRSSVTPSFFLEKVRRAAGLDHVIDDVSPGSREFLERSRHIDRIIAIDEAGICLVEVRLFDKFVAVLHAGIRCSEERRALAVVDGMTYETEFHYSACF